MTEQEIRIAITEACGQSADYPSDLNAMAKAEEILTPEQQGEYLANVVKPLPRARWTYHLLRATASQRAEAFLKTLGKWREVL